MGPTRTESMPAKAPGPDLAPVPGPTHADSGGLDASEPQPAAWRLRAEEEKEQGDVASDDRRRLAFSGGPPRGGHGGPTQAPGAETPLGALALNVRSVIAPSAACDLVANPLNSKIPASPATGARR